MLNLAFIFHMHQPYYKNLLTQEAEMPWVRLHGIKDYLDMVQMLQKYPRIKQTFNLVPSLMEQVEDYANRTVKDVFLLLSYKPAAQLTQDEQKFIAENFFMINKERVIAMFPRYYELCLMKERGDKFNTQDYLDLQVWFNLAWTDPYFRNSIPELTALVRKARFFTEEEKQTCLDKQTEILEDILPAYRRFIEKGQVEVIVSPFYHPILPLLFNTNIAREANTRTTLPKVVFSYPEDARHQVEEAAHFYQKHFGIRPHGMWPSEESVSEHILPFFIQAGINWIVADEAILFKSLKKKKRDTALLYQPHLLKRESGDLYVVFRDRNLSDLIGFVYHQWDTKSAVDDFMRHLKNISDAFPRQDVLVTVAMDGENAWEYYSNDGHDFLELLYQKLSEADFIKTTTVNDYLKTHVPKSQIKRLAAGSWIFANFGKWIGNPLKNKAWEYLAQARDELNKAVASSRLDSKKLALAWKQMYVLEGSDWFWWYGDNHDGFDKMFRMHLANFYTIIGKDAPDYVFRPLTT